MLHSQTKPTLSTSKVWSATDMYEFVPVNATWAGGVATITFKNHQLSSGDVVVFSCVETTNAWHAGEKVATVVDKDTFTVPFVADPGYLPNTKPYAQDHTNRRVTVRVPKYSKMFYLQNFLQVDSVGTATGLKLQFKLNEEATWVDSNLTLTAGVHKIPELYNFLRISAAGADSSTTLPVVYTQKSYTV